MKARQHGKSDTTNVTKNIACILAVIASLFCLSGCETSGDISKYTIESPVKDGENKKFDFGGIYEIAIEIGESSELICDVFGVDSDFVTVDNAAPDVISVDIEYAIGKAVYLKIDGKEAGIGSFVLTDGESVSRTISVSVSDNSQSEGEMSQTSQLPSGTPEISGEKGDLENSDTEPESDISDKALSADFTDNDADTRQYIGNIKSGKFHSQSCNSLPKEENRVYITGRDNALNDGFEPCKRCNP